MGITDNVENFITRVSMQGVETMTRQQVLLGAGFRAIRGDLAGASASLGKMGITLGMTGAAAGVMGAGLRSVAGFLNEGIKGAAEAEGAITRLSVALKDNGGRKAADDIAGYAEQLQRVAPYEDDMLVNAAAMIASFPQLRSGIKEFLPALMDLDSGLKKMGKGEGKSLEDYAIMLGKGATFAAGSLRRMGIDIDQARVDAEGYPALLREINKEFGGQAQAAAGTYNGALLMQQYAWGNLQESMGKGFLPILTKVTKSVTESVNAMTKINEATHGFAGYAALAVVGGVGLIGMLTMAKIAIRTLRDEWLGVAGAADLAAGSQQRAAGAGIGAGKGIKGLGVGIGAGIVGAVISGLTSSGGAEAAAAKNAGKSSLGASGKAGLNVLGGGISGAATGAMIGSIIPGLGTAVGGAIGGVAGAGISAYNQISQFKAGLKTPVADNLAKSSNQHLSKIRELLEKQVNGVVGGGNRVAKAWNTGDLERAVMGTLARGVV